MRQANNGFDEAPMGVDRRIAQQVPLDSIADITVRVLEKVGSLQDFQAACIYVYKCRNEECVTVSEFNDQIFEH